MEIVVIETYSKEMFYINDCYRKSFLNNFYYFTISNEKGLLSNVIR